MITTGAQLKTFINGLNAEADVDATLLDVLVDSAKTVLEAERPWMVLQQTDTSLSATTTNTWSTAIDISTITDFNRFYGERPVKLFDGDNQVSYYHQVPLNDRLEYKDVSGTFIYDANGSQIYLNGSVTFNGTLYLSHIINTAAIDLTSESAVWSPFPARFLPVLGFYAIGIYKGAVDYDSINRQMLPENRAALLALKNAMEKWDNDLQLSAMEINDPTIPYAPGLGRIDRYND